MTVNDNNNRAAAPDLEPDTDRAAVKAILAMAREPGYDFPGRLAAALCSVAAELGSADALVASRPGSWEAELVRRLVESTAGDDLERFRMEGLSDA